MLKLCIKGSYYVWIIIILWLPLKSLLKMNTIGSFRKQIFMCMFVFYFSLDFEFWCHAMETRFSLNGQVVSTGSLCSVWFYGTRCFIRMGEFQRKVTYNSLSSFIYFFLYFLFLLFKIFFFVDQFTSHRSWTRKSRNVILAFFLFYISF